MANETVPMKRSSLVLPEPLFEELKRVAEEHNTTVGALLRRYVKLGLLADHLEKTPDAGLYIREGDRETRIMMM